MSRIVTLREGHVDKTVEEVSVGGVTADRLIDDIRREHKTVEHAWLEYAELMTKFGAKSAACSAFVKTLAKRAAT